MAAKVVMIMSTVSDLDTAQKLAKAWVEQSKAACVSILPGVESTYRWQAKLMQEQEVMLLIKTSFASEEAGKKLLAAFAADHPYEEPEFLVFEADSAAPGYASWVFASVGGKA